MIDETTAMAVAQQPRSPPLRVLGDRLTLSALWVLGGVAGALIGSSINPSAFGLDAAAPAIFLALLWPQLKAGPAPVVALVGAAVALALIGFTPAGVPVIAARPRWRCRGHLHQPFERRLGGHQPFERRLGDHRPFERRLRDRARG